MPSIAAIVAMSQNHVIGKNNQLPWHLPADLKHFKDLTTGHPIIMGRKTFQSIGKVLPNRTNIVVTRNKNYRVEGAFVVGSIEEAIELASAKDNNEVFIIGGADIFKLSMPRINRLYLTIIQANIEGDVYFPKLESQQWQETASSQHLPDEKNNYAYQFVTLDRIA